MPEHRTGGRIHELLFGDETTDFPVYRVALSGPAATPVFWATAGVPTRPTSRALSDYEFGELLEDLRGTIDRSAVATQSVAAGLGSLHTAITATKEELLQALRSDRRPRTLHLATLGSDRFRLVCPLPVEVSVDTEGVVAAQSPDLEQYGTGDTDYEALDDLRHAIADSYSYLLDHEAELGPHPRNLLTRYRQLIDLTK